MEFFRNSELNRTHRSGSQLGMSTKKILLVEDEADIRDLISLHLMREGYQVVAVANGEDGISQIVRESFDLLVLDWMLPALSGLEITQMVRRSTEQRETNSTVPILMVTAKAESRDIVNGLESGADDYLTKPFELPVLVARVKALLRRSEAATDSAKTPLSSEIRFGGIVIYPEMHEVYSNDEKLKLTRSEFKLLEALAKSQGRVLTRDTLIQLVQGDDVAVTGRTIDTHVFGLRKKLGANADVIETIRGVGYRVPITD